MLAAAKFHLDLLNNRAKHDPAQQAIITHVSQMLLDAIQKSRSLSHELSPAALYQGTLTDALVWLANQIQTKHGLVVRVNTTGKVDAQADGIKTFLYKAAQELLFNVVKHARVNEARLRVRRLGQCICLSVSDRGRGFDPKEVRQAAGFGLLSIRERVELLGGRMRMHSLKGKGSTFYIAVPDTEGVTRGRTPAVREEKLPAGSQPPLRVLLADDHEIVREGLISLLADEHDIQVVGEAANGREAIDQAYRLQPDVVIMDVAMPLINGDDATRQIKMHLPQTRVIALSMYEETDMIEKMCRAGAEGYILKTAPAEQLLAVIRGKR
jgi:CheY-like chemotaxis protein